tara:strand:+ start:236 stop:958 length:723 start_codon:yes stop_codon:yes gene_type:complete
MLRICGKSWRCLIWVAILIGLFGDLHAQKPEIIYTGLEDATSLYATTNHLFVVESGKNRILKLDHDGMLIETLGGFGSGDYQFNGPTDIDATNGLKIYISDTGNNRVQIYDRRFQFLSTIDGSMISGIRRFQPTQLVVNEFGELFVFDTYSNSILRFDENGSLISSFKPVNGLIPDEIVLVNEQLELTDAKKGVIQIMSQNGLSVELFEIDFQGQELIRTATVKGLVFLLTGGTIEKEAK